MTHVHHYNYKSAES